MAKMHKIEPITYDEPMAGSPEIYPMVSFDEMQLPEIKKWKVGEDYMIVLKVTQKRLQEGHAGQLMADFDIKEVGVKGAKSDAEEEA